MIHIKMNKNLQNILYRRLNTKTGLMINPGDKSFPVSVKFVLLTIKMVAAEDQEQSPAQVSEKLRTHQPSQC